MSEIENEIHNMAKLLELRPVLGKVNTWFIEDGDERRLAFDWYSGTKRYGYSFPPQHTELDVRRFAAFFMGMHFRPEFEFLQTAMQIYRPGMDFDAAYVAYLAEEAEELLDAMESGKEMPWTNDENLCKQVDKTLHRFMLVQSFLDVKAKYMKDRLEKIRSKDDAAAEMQVQG